MEAVRSIVRIFGAVASFAGLLIGAQAGAQITQPEPLIIEQAQAPTNQFGMPMEGWIVLRYAVLADGTTDNVTVIDKQPERLPDRIGVDAVESWTFEPATADGTPIEWHNNEAVLVFDAEQVPTEPSPRFLAAWQDVQSEFNDDKAEKALRSNRAMSTGMMIGRLSEIGLAQMQAATINLSLGNMHAALAAI